MKKVFAFGLDLEVDDWVKFLAVDWNGNVYGFEIKPSVSGLGWYAYDGGKSDYIISMEEEFSNFSTLLFGV